MRRRLRERMAEAEAAHLGRWAREHGPEASEVERILREGRRDDLRKRVRKLRPRRIPDADPAHALHLRTLYVVLPVGQGLTEDVLDYASEIGANVLHDSVDPALNGEAQRDERVRLFGRLDEDPFLALEDVAFRDEVQPRVERELSVLAPPIRDDWAPLTAPARLSPMPDEACQLEVVGVGDPRLRLRVDGQLVLDVEDRPAEMRRDRIFTVRYPDGVRVGPQIVVEARQPKHGGASVAEAVIRVGKVVRTEVHRRWRRWGQDDVEE